MKVMIHSFDPDAGPNTETLEYVDYAEEVRRLRNPDLDAAGVALGLNGEAGEFGELIKKERYHGVEIDPERKIKELGDVLWYLVAACADAGTTLEAVAKRNVEKLRERYPDGFRHGGGNR